MNNLEKKVVAILRQADAGAVKLLDGLNPEERAWLENELDHIREHPTSLSSLLDAASPRSVLTALHKGRVEMGFEDILRDAIELEERLDKAGVMKLLEKYDDSAIAQGILKLALDRRASMGAKRVIRDIKRYAHHVL